MRIQSAHFGFVRATAFMVIVLIAISVGANVAEGADPDCDMPAADQTVWHLENGDGRFCTPSFTRTGQELPETGYPIECIVSVDGFEYLRFPNLGPGVVVIVVQGPYRFAHPVEIACDNGFGSGPGVLSTSGRFPPDGVDRPTVLE